MHMKYLCTFRLAAILLEILKGVSCLYHYTCKLNIALSYEPNLGLPKTKGITDLVYIKKVISVIKFYIFKFTFFKISHEIRLISWMKSARFHHEICQIS